MQEISILKDRANINITAYSLYLTVYVAVECHITITYLYLRVWRLYEVAMFFVVLQLPIYSLVVLGYLRLFDGFEN